MAREMNDAEFRQAIERSLSRAIRAVSAGESVEAAVGPLADALVTRINEIEVRILNLVDSLADVEATVRDVDDDGTLGVNGKTAKKATIRTAVDDAKTNATLADRAAAVDGIVSANK